MMRIWKALIQVEIQFVSETEGMWLNRGNFVCPVMSFAMCEQRGKSSEFVKQKVVVCARQRLWLVKLMILIEEGC